MSAPLTALAGARALGARRAVAARRGSRADGLVERRGKGVRLVLVTALALLAVCVARVWLSIQVVDLGYQLSTLRSAVTRLEQEERELEIELATLSSPRRLADQAKRRLRLRAPGKDQVVVVR